MLLRINATTKAVLHASTVPFTVLPIEGVEMDCVLPDNLVWPADLRYCRVTSDGQSVEINPLTPITTPKTAEFKSWLRANASQAIRNLIRATYCEFLEDLNAQDWPKFQTGCQYVRDNTTTTQLSAGVWTAFKNACVAYNIPVTLT